MQRRKKEEIGSPESVEHWRKIDILTGILKITRLEVIRVAVAHFFAYLIGQGEVKDEAEPK